MTTWNTAGASDLSGLGVSALFGGTFYGTSQTYAADTINVALYGNTPIPNKDDTLAHNSYNGSGGQWVTANENASGGGYTTGGAALGTKTNAEATGVVTISGANQAWTSATFSAVYGCLVYDNTITGKAAYCWNYFGGSQSVVSGTFTVVWSGSGIMSITIS